MEHYVQLQEPTLGPFTARRDTVNLSRGSYLGLTKMVEISGDQGPLGIHVVPYCSSLSGRALGLHIRGVEENSRSKREGIFQEDECIIKINDTELMDKSFSQAQEIFRQAMLSPIVRLGVVPLVNKEHFEKTVIGHLFNSESLNGAAHTKDLAPVKVRPAQAEIRESSSSLLESSLTPATTSADSPLLKPPEVPSQQSYGRKSGKRLRIDLKKGPEGLGFTVVTRDSSVHGPGPILVKNILPRGAAIKDGRLQSGDRIQEVNGVDITGHSQEELVAMLRSTKQGDSVCLVVARQEDMFLPRELVRVFSCSNVARQPSLSCFLFFCFCLFDKFPDDPGNLLDRKWRRRLGHSTGSAKQCGVRDCSCAAVCLLFLYFLHPIAPLATQ
ncbi:hypothetical protein DNTS_021367 [Danionella cerebrum]|uniref:PDZ domain-containing protein n=1 Tax=Danionella cerebrum TaxID=2873325 RepID=A0A553N096_9TELE|nr:hypothetical protein DNTS_021367 [Danionella translucida]